MKERRAAKSALQAVKRPSCEETGAACEQHCKGHPTEREDEKAQHRLHFSGRSVMLLHVAENRWIFYGKLLVSCIYQNQQESRNNKLLLKA